MNFALSLVDRITRLLMVLGCAATLLMMLHISVDVVGRLLFKRPIPGTLEVVTYIYMVAVVFLPLAIVQRERKQIIVELFSHMLPKRILAALDGAVAIVGCVFMMALAWYSGHDAWAQTLIRETAPSELNPIPIWPARWMVTVAAVLAAVYLAIQSAEDLRVAFTRLLPEAGVELEEPGSRIEAI